MNNLQDQGRACYKRGEYKQAISFFDRAIGRGSSAHLFDNRAACHEKLGDLQSALKDAKNAIQLGREDATGYLRAGKVLVKMNKGTVAFEIYSHGLRSIKHVGQGYELLRKVHKDLLDKLSPPKSVDPMTVLPRELAESILEYLDFRQRMHVCLVTKQWANFVRSCPRLWQHLDLSQARRKVRSAFISRAINCGRTKLVTATLKNLYDPDKALEALNRHCAIEELTLLDPGVSTRSLHAILHSAKRLKMLYMCPSDAGCYFQAQEVPDLLHSLHQNLEVFECRISGAARMQPKPPTCPALRRLSVIYRGGPDTERIYDNVAHRMPMLETLRIQNDAPMLSQPSNVSLESCAHLTHVDLKLGFMNASFVKLPPTLISLKLASTQRYLPTSFWLLPGPAGTQPLMFYLPNLEALQLELPGMVVHDVQYALDSDTLSDLRGAKPSKLRHLTIRSSTLNCRSISETLKHPRLSDLEQLHLPQLATCGDDDIAAIMDSLPKLKSLDVSETNITGVGVKTALKPGHLVELVVNDCSKISLDAIQWAREQDVKVQHRMSDGSGRGRKVRY